MGIVHPFLVVDDGGPGHGTGLVVVVRRHNEQVPFFGCGSAAIDKKGLVHFRSVHRQRDVLGRISTQSAGIFIAVLALLAQGKPDAFIAVGFGAVDNGFRV